MRDAARALGLDVPDVEGGFHELVGVDCVDRRQPAPFTFGPAERTIESTLARDHDPLGRVAQHRIRRAAERAPRAASGRALALAPDDLAAQKQFEIVLKNANDVGGEAAVRLAPEVRDVHRDATAGLELAGALREHVGQQLEILDVRARNTVALELFLVLLPREIRRRRDDQRDRTVDDGVHVPGVAVHERLDDVVRLDHGVVAGEGRRLEPLVERGRVVTLPPARTEVGRGRCTTARHTSWFFGSGARHAGSVRGARDVMADSARTLAPSTRNAANVTM